MGQEIVDLTEAGDTWSVAGFLDDDPRLAGADVLGVQVLGGREWLNGRRTAVALGVGAPAARRRLSRELERLGMADYPILIHPAAYVGRGCTVGAGSIIGAGATLTTDVHVGRFVIVNAGATVSHNSRLANFATIAPGVHLAGNTVVEEGADIGVGASVIPGLTVGAWSVIGAGSVVIRDVPADTTVVGCPARVISERQPGWHS